MPASRTPSRRRVICLVGFMGCGKTTIGRLLARQLAWRFVDLDTRIEERAGLLITEIFDRLGEPAFRRMEHECLLQALGEAGEQDTPTVVALGGGTFAQPPNVELLRGWAAPDEPAGRGARCVVIWLDCPIEVIFARCATMADRPLLRDEASFRQLWEQRRPFYQQADYRVEANAEPRRVIEQILALGILNGPASSSRDSATSTKKPGGRVSA